MPEKTDLNISPYYDDYSEDKNFHKVLFRAGRPLQARELTQSQSILQNQVERLGGHFFKEGSIVAGVQSGIDLELYYAKVDTENPNTNGDDVVETYRESFHGKLIRGKTSGVVAKVIDSSAKTSDDELTIFFKYLTSGTNNEYTFTAGEELQEVTVDSGGAYSVVSANNNEFKVLPSTNNSIGVGSRAEIDEGVIFTRGFFVKVPKQHLLLEKYSSRPSYRIGLKIEEKLISNSEDSSLQDNAQGSSNENAAGADRFQVNLTLAKFTIDTQTDANFIELIRVNQGIIELQISNPIYNTIEKTLARRTYDANGDFVVRQFTQSLREHLDDTTNRGFYPVGSGGKEDKFVMQVSPGKAYVRGFEIDKTGTTTIPFSKARSTKSLSNAKSPIRLGNKLRVSNAHGLPEVIQGVNSTGITPYKFCKLWPSVVAVDGTENSEDFIGYARVRDIELHDGSDTSGVYASNSEYDLSMFDIKMFTKLPYASHTGTAQAGDKITGSATGATGIVAYDNNSDALYVHDVVGSFSTNDVLSSEGAGNFACSISGTPRNYNIDRTRSITQTPTNGSRETFTADINTDAVKILTGTLVFGASSTAVSGVGTLFASELKEGDIIVNPLGGQELIVSSITNDISLTLTSNSTNAYQGNVERRRVKLIDQDQTVNIFSWPRDWVKDHTADLVKVKRQTVQTIGASGNVTIAQTEGTFEDQNTDNFSIAVIDVSSASAPTFSAGDTLNIEDYEDTSPTQNGDGQSITLTGFGAANENVVLRITYSVLIADPTPRTKDLNKGRALRVSGDRNDSYTGVYGSSFRDKEVSLGIADVFKIRGIYEGVGGTPVTPNASLTDEVGTFQLHEVLVGQTSNARAVLIDYNSGGTSYWYMISGRFQENEFVVGQDSLAQATLTDVSQGSPNITSRYFFDDGQRDGYYDICKLVRKPAEPAPNNQILIVFDQFSHGDGDFFDVTSYSVPYKDIPVYSANKVDLGGLEPDGTYELSDALDFRPVVGQLYDIDLSTNPDLSSVSDISTAIEYAPFSYEKGRSYLSSRDKESTNTGYNYDTNPSLPGTPVTGSSVQGDIEFYVGRIDKLFLHKSGKFQISSGEPALSPTKPKGVDGAIEMFELTIPPFTKNLKNIRVRSQDHRRFTMKDIGKINQRVTNLERVTSLSLLEKDTQTKQILDGDGFDRFKSGFLVDNFRGHRVGDVNHPDYKNSVDSQLGVLRPQSYSQFFDIGFKSATSQNFKKTGDLLTLPYTEVTFVNQDKASRAINVNPYHVFAFIGDVKLTPETDVWNDSERLPEVRVNREGNFDAVLAENANSLGTVWNAWQTTWVGQPQTISTEITASSNGSWSGDPTQGGEWVPGLQVSREITETPEIQTRTGVSTSVVEDFVESRNDRLVSVSIIPFIRAKTIEIDATNLKPDTWHYVYFDDVPVGSYVRPFSSAYAQDGSSTTLGKGVKTDGNGRLRAYFELPNSNTQRFPTGQRELKLTSSKYNERSPSSAGTGIYQAQGLLQSNQTEIVSTRNGRVVTERLSGERNFSTRGEVVNATNIDTTAPAIPQPPTIPNEPPEPPIIIDPPVLPPEPPVVPPVIIQDPPPPPQPPELPPFEFDFDFPIFDIGNDFNFIWSDPLAQSFLVDAKGGVMLSSIDLFFKTRDENLPVSVQVRTMVNGYPGPNVVPFSTVTKNPSEINLSQDGSTATTFTFESPVFLETNQEYVFVVYSNSNEYEVFHSRMGETDLATGQTISGQPYAGSLFKSQNNSTWTAAQEDDLKFHLRACKFDTSVSGYLEFENLDLPNAKLQNNPIETVSGQTYVKVYNYTHGMYNTSSNVTISGVTGDRTGSVLEIQNAIDSGSLPSDGTYDIVHGGTVGSDSVTITTNGSGDVTENGIAFEIKVETLSGSADITRTRILQAGSGHAAGDIITCTIGSTFSFTVTLVTVGDTLGGIPIDAINQTFTSIGSTFTMDTFRVTPDISGYDFVSDYSASESTIGGGDEVYSTRNYYYDTLHTVIPNVTPEDCFISVHKVGTPMNSPEGYINGTVYNRRTAGEIIALNDNVFFSYPSVVASRINEQNEMSSNRSFRCALQLVSGNSNLSPVVDLSSLGAIAIANRLNGLNSSDAETIAISTESEGEDNAMCYITKKVNLKAPASGLRVTADIFRPATTDVKVMYKIIKNDEESAIDDIGFEFFNGDGSPDTVIDADARNFKEYEFSADDLPEFSGFIIKIVGRGYNTSTVPLVSALRCIAVA
jgi:hypothetical protein